MTSPTVVDILRCIDLAAILHGLVAIRPPYLTRVLAHPRRALRVSCRLWHRLRALLAAGAAVTWICGHGALAPILPVVVTVRPPRMASVLTLASVALAVRIRELKQTRVVAGTAEAQVVIVGQSGFTAIVQPVVAVRQAGLAGVGALALDALGDNSRFMVRNALRPAQPTIVNITADILLASIAPVAVAITPSLLTAIFAHSLRIALLDSVSPSLALASGVSRRGIGRT